MKNYLLLFIIITTSIATKAQQKYWQQQTNFNITVTLNDQDNTLTGFEKIDYINNSPDTLTYIWLHLWPNAYKNDHTAFSDQQLENGSTNFYFSEENKKGYINRLNFKIDNVNAITEDHPQHQDIVKLILLQPLLPQKKINISTPFHVKLPYNFSRGGHVDQSYQITQWYPKPAVYDKDGWHPMPYLDQGEFYSEFGNFDVEITLPQNYVVAATGELQDENEKNWILEKANSSYKNETTKSQKIVLNNTTIPSSSTSKTIRYVQNNVHDFAWFADKSFLVKYDTIKLTSGNVVDAYSFYLPKHHTLWKNSILFTKKAIQSKSNWLGEYPYKTITIVDNAAPTSGGMEYPTITLLSAEGSEENLEAVINHEVGHNWFYAILATNERQYPWMDEGMNTYYDEKYKTEYATIKQNDDDGSRSFFEKLLPTNIEHVILQTAIKLKKDQPINTVSEKFSILNYDLVAYQKTSEWLKKLEQEIGAETFAKAMKVYYEKWKFKHPQPQDFKDIMEQVSGKNLDVAFGLLNKKGTIEKVEKKKTKLTTFFNLKETDKYNYVAIAPALGYNSYDKLMLGITIHNYNLPPNNFQFFVAPLYATGTKKMNGIARASYEWYLHKNGDKLTVALAAAKFTGGSYKDSTGTKNPLQYSKIVPTIKYEFANTNARSTIKKFIQLKTYFINETKINFSRDLVNNIDVITYPREQRYVNQLQLGMANNRALYPYNALVQAEQGDGFVRLNFTTNYYFNYAKGGGMDVRFFVGKFIYTRDKSFINQYKTEQYHLNLTGAKGNEDYTYNNYFVGRNEFEGLGSQQIANRDGFFKVRTDLLSSKIGKTDDWLSAINVVTDIPTAVNIFKALPIKIPVRLFADVGTFAEAWKKGNTSGRFLYDAGLKISLLKNVINIYIPLLYSKVYGDYFKSTITEKRFQKNISFSIDLQELKISKLLPQFNY